MKRLPVVAAVLALGFSAGNVGAAPPAACTASSARTLVRAFVTAFDRGRVSAIDRMWAPVPRFQWFSTGRPAARLGPDAYDRTTLAAWFRARVRAHERLRIVELGARYERRRNIVNFAGKLVRSADDLRPRLHDFKGAADCVRGRPTLIVWSM